MQRIPVESSNIASIGYDRSSMTLEVEFKRGGTYQYFDVSPDLHDALMKSGSKGEYFVSTIRGHYRYARV
jgi:hypothetical protein